MKPKVSLIVSLDTECDKGPDWKIRQPLSFLNITEGIPVRLQPLFESYNIKPTYLLSPEVIRDEECVQLFTSIGNKVELGTHLHAEFIAPDANYMSDKTIAFQSDYDVEIERAKLTNLTSLFYEIFTYKPRTFRAGRFGISQFTLSILDDLGYTVDSSVTPYKWWWRKRGEGVNHLGASNQPYYPSIKDFRRPGDMKILEVPVTLVNPFWQKLPTNLLLNLNPFNRYQTIILNTLLRNRIQPTWLRPTYSSAEEMLWVTEMIAKENNPAVLCMMFHSNEATASMSPYHKTNSEVDAFMGQMKDYFECLYTHYDVVSIGLSETRCVDGLSERY